MSFNTPILLICFNRPTHTRKVFEEIKKQKPRQLFVFQDGARVGNETDKEKCEAVRAIFEEPMDWECELHTYFSTTNLGCGKGPATAISWLFEHVEAGIIFEDDCLPHPDFFTYCEQLLDKYKDNMLVSFIGGTNFQDGIYRGDASYYFSAGHHGTWGWATWKRVWMKFDYYLNNPNGKELDRVLRTYFYDSRQIDYWKAIWDIVLLNRCDESCWDYQFYMTCWKDNLLAIIPNQNLITNIGFDEFATHTSGANHEFANRSTMPLMPIRDPQEIIQDKRADYYLHKTYVQPYEYGWSGLKRLPYRINKRIKRFFGIKGSWIKQ